MAIELEWRDDGTTDSITSLAELEAALDRLEADARADRPIVVTLYHPDGRSLSVGLGHTETALSMTGPDGMGPFHVSDNGGGDDKPVAYVSSGIWTDFPRWSLVPSSAGRTAIRHFFETGEPTPALSWRTDQAGRPEGSWRP